MARRNGRFRLSSEPLAAFGAAAGDHLLAAFGGHAGAIAMTALAHQLAGLIGTFHGTTPEFLKSKVYKGSRQRSQTNSTPPQTKLTNGGKINFSQGLGDGPRRGAGVNARTALLTRLSVMTVPTNCIKLRNKAPTNISPPSNQAQSYHARTRLAIFAIKPPRKKRPNSIQTKDY